MNVNTLLNKVKLKNGIGKFLKIQMSDKDLIEKVCLSLCLSKYSEFIKHVLFLPNTILKEVDMSQALYEIPYPEYLEESMKQAGVAMAGIRSMKRNNQYSGNILTSSNWVTLPNGHFYGNEYGSRRLSVAYEYYSTLEANDLGYKCQFIQPNRIRFLDPIIDYRHIHFDFEMYISHSKNLSTIDDNMALTFERLFGIMVRHVLWENELKYIQGLETSFNTVNLHIDEWEHAKEELEALYKDLEDARISIMPMAVI